MTREQIQSHLDANEIQIKEVTKKQGGEFAGKSTEELLAMSQREERIAQQWQRNGDPHQADVRFRRAEQITAGMEDQDLGSGGNPKFTQYTLPGAENYREVLLTMPQGSGRQESTNALRKVLYEKYGAAYPQKWTPEEHAKMKQLEGELGAQPKPFQSGHWDEPNVPAHLRLSDRTVGGKRTLLVEELQSDWAQKGRREGFQEPTDQSKFPTYEQWLEAEITPEARKDEAVNRRVYENDKSRWLEAQRKGIPQAPFVTDTGKWTALGLKRVLKMIFIQKGQEMFMVKITGT